MKLVFLMYLEEDDPLVMNGFKALGVSVFSRIALEGRQGAGAGGGRAAAAAAGWYGDVPPFRSQMVFAVFSDEEAEALLEAVRHWPPGQDSAHPVRAFQVDVERAVTQQSAS